MEEQRADVVVIGAGPSGLSAAYELLKHGRRPIVLERNNIVGGLARTESYHGFLFDMGGHRFFTKNTQIEQLWKETLGSDFLLRQRLSRIYYRKRFFPYPLKPFRTLQNLGVCESARILLSYAYSQLRPSRQEQTFEQWVTNRFGSRLFETFFKAYTEKVWGISCSELKAEWAAQRIKDLSLKTALLSMFSASRTVIRTLIETFHYPRHGPGMMWRRFESLVNAGGGTVDLNADVVRILNDGHRITAVEVRTETGLKRVRAEQFISTMPISVLVKRLDPPAPPTVLQNAAKLKHRALVVVGLILTNPEPFPDNWIYVHDPEVTVGRIQNFRAWSREMVPVENRGSVGMEYFCDAHDELWSQSDSALIEKAAHELAHLGLAQPSEIVDGCVFRVPEAYPVYDSEYESHLSALRRFLEQFTNLQTIGRNGMHRYNNQDHAMLSGVLAARNLACGEQHDIWKLNEDQAYFEETRRGELSDPSPSELLVESSPAHAVIR